MKVFIVVNTLHIFEEVLNQTHIQHLFIYCTIFSPKLFSGEKIGTSAADIKTKQSGYFREHLDPEKGTRFVLCQRTLFQFVQQILG